MRILYFVERFLPVIGGVEVLSARLLPGLARRGHEVTVVTSAERDTPVHERVEGVEIRRYPMLDAIRAQDIDAVAAIRAGIGALRRELRPDVVHSVFTGPTLFFPLTTARAHPSPSLLSFHGYWTAAELERFTILPRAIAAADWITACSTALLAELRALDPGIASRSLAIVNGLDPMLEPSPLRLDPPLLLCAARLVEKKGIDVAIEAMGAVRGEFPGARLLIAGEGPTRGPLAARLPGLGLLDAVEFLGWVSPEDMPALVDSASAVLVPSRHEGFGLIALEGMLGARPVVASRVGGLPEVLGDDGGLLVEPGDPAALAGAIVSLLSEPEQAARLGEAGRRRALARFGLSRCVEEHELLYERLVART